MKIKIEAGDFVLRKDEGVPYITDVDDNGGKLGYLWIGTDQRCFGTISGPLYKKLKEHLALPTRSPK